MDENPGETPNPLNPNPTKPVDFVSEPDSMPEERPADRPRPVAPKTVPIKEPMKEPVEEPVENEPASIEELAEEIVEVSTTEPASEDPMARPMEKAPTEEVAKPAKKKKKLGLIIGMIACLFVAVGCAVAAALFLINKNDDAVSLALQKLFSDDTPANIAVSGTIDINIDDASSAFSNVTIALDTKATKTSAINSTTAVLTASLRGGDDQISVELDEVYAANGELFLKIDGIKNALDEIATRQSIIEDEDCTTADCVIETEGDEIASLFASAYEALDGEWIRIPLDETPDMSSLLEGNSDMQCLVDLINDASTNSNSIVNLYTKHPFISSTTENIRIPSKQNPIYQVTFDDEKLTAFLNSAENTTVVQNFSNCLGYENATINYDNITAEIDNLPTIYVEVDGNYDFTRLYFTTDFEGNAVTVDFSFSYPTNVNVSEPVEYTDITDIMTKIFTLDSGESIDFLSEV